MSSLPVSIEVVDIAGDTSRTSSSGNAAKHSGRPSLDVTNDAAIDAADGAARGDSEIRDRGETVFG